MKNVKLVAILKLVLTFIVFAGLGYLVIQKPEVQIKPQTQENATDKVENSEEVVKKDEKSEEEKENEDSKETLDENADANSKETEPEKAKEDEDKVDESNANGEEDEEQKEKKEIKFSNPLSYKKINLGLDLAGGVSVTYEAQTEEDPSKEEMASAVQLLRQRLTDKGHTEAEVASQGTKKIRVEMPGVDNPKQAVEEIGQTAELKFYGVFNDGYQIQRLENGAYVLFKQNPDSQYGIDFYTGENISSIGEQVLGGSDIKDAFVSRNQVSQTSGYQPVVSLRFNDNGTKAFADATRKYKNNYIAIVLDDNIISIPTVESEIAAGEAIINGMESMEVAESLANLIKAGSLPFKLEAVETNIIGARLGNDALVSSLKAGLVGLILVAVFMIIVYALPGLLSAIALAFYMVIVMCILASFSVTLTLPGIAGIILSIGMAVDANVIIFTRIKEEIMLGKTIASAVETGFEKAKSAIIDGNITTLIIAGILYWLGIGTIRGFAQTLAIGIIVSMFTAMVITRFLLKMLLQLGLKNPILFGVRKSKEAEVAAETPVVKTRKHEKVKK